jgi:hypothetical protein
MTTRMSRPRRSLVLALALAGCFVPSPSEKEALRDQVREWHDDVRWQRFPAAALRLPPARRQRFLEQTRTALNDIGMADYEILSVQPAGDGRAEVRASFDWEAKQSALLRHTEVAELWQRVGSDWVLMGVKLEKGEALPFLTPPSQ